MMLPRLGDYEIMSQNIIEGFQTAFHKLENSFNEKLEKFQNDLHATRIELDKTKMQQMAFAKSKQMQASNGLLPFWLQQQQEAQQQMLARNALRQVQQTFPQQVAIQPFFSQRSSLLAKKEDENSKIREEEKLKSLQGNLLKELQSTEQKMMEKEKEILQDENKTREIDLKTLIDSVHQLMKSYENEKSSHSKRELDALRNVEAQINLLANKKDEVMKDVKAETEGMEKQIRENHVEEKKVEDIELLGIKREENDTKDILRELKEGNESIQKSLRDYVKSTNAAQNNLEDDSEAIAVTLSAIQKESAEKESDTLKMTEILNKLEKMAGDNNVRDKKMAGILSYIKDVIDGKPAEELERGKMIQEAIVREAEKAAKEEVEKSMKDLDAEKEMQEKKMKQQMQATADAMRIESTKEQEKVEHDLQELKDSAKRRSEKVGEVEKEVLARKSEEVNHKNSEEKPNQDPDTQRKEDVATEEKEIVKEEKGSQDKKKQQQDKADAKDTEISESEEEEYFESEAAESESESEEELEKLLFF
eukprot:g3260.t1